MFGNFCVMLASPNTGTLNNSDKGLKLYVHPTKNWTPIH